MTRALAMVSGGLDSILAAKLIKDQGIDVIGICFRSHFFNEENAKKMVKQIDIPLKVVDFSPAHFEMVKNPKNGYGKNMNPCIDCHAMMMRYCGQLLEELEADFIITGEVLNQRPMSQNRMALDRVKKESGIQSKILRPLCAKMLVPTEMEENGLVDREKLMDIQGRSRKVQMELAEQWGIKEYPSPAGGCKLTEPNYSVRLKELLTFNKDPEERELGLLRVGRHFRVTPNAKVVSTRTQDEVALLKKYLGKDDTILLVKDFNGSMVVIIGEATEEVIRFAAKVAIRYSKGKDEPKVTVKYAKFGEQNHGTVDETCATDAELDAHI
ncbi:MAG: tRNA 4-thiouridine(8) synthase ThiI, partial [Clostridium sp.]